MARAVAHEEETHQVALVQWADYTPMPAAAGLEGTIGDYLMHPANGGWRGKAEAARFKRMGVRPGYPDIVVDVPASGYAGLRLELKARGAYPRRSQREWHQRLRSAGFRVEVHRDWTQAAEAIMQYLKGESRDAE